MIDFKFYKELQVLAEKLGLPADKETMRLYVKLCERFGETQSLEINRLNAKNREGRLQHGQVAVNNKGIKEHLRICKRVVDGIDESMKMPVNFARGSRIAKLMNELNSSLFIFGNYSVKTTSSIEGQAEHEELLIATFNKERDDLLLKAACDDTKRHNLRYVLSIEDNVGGTVNYNKKENRFDFIEYSLNGYGKSIPL